MRFYAGPTLLVIDELGYLPLPTEAAAALFQVVSQRYSRTSAIITTNRGIESWAVSYTHLDVYKRQGRLVEGAAIHTWKTALAELALVYPDRVNPHL